MTAFWITMVGLTALVAVGTAWSWVGTLRAFRQWLDGEEREGTE